MAAKQGFLVYYSLWQRPKVSGQHRKVASNQWWPLRGRGSTVPATLAQHLGLNSKQSANELWVWVTTETSPPPPQIYKSFLQLLSLTAEVVHTVWLF